MGKITVTACEVDGKVIEGLDIVDKIAKVPTTYHGWYDDVPRVPVVIEKVEIVE